MEYNFDIEKKWQDRWNKDGRYKVENDPSKPKCYVLDMFPYPSGAGLHVGHPLGYIASDIYARYKRLKGFNVLHTMGYDAFGLPAEQYAIDHGIHPAVSTAANIANFRAQLDHIGFCFDWSREVNTSDPGYYKWTQWIFLQLFKSWYDRSRQKALPIDDLISRFETAGNKDCPCPGDPKMRFDAGDWKAMDEAGRQTILMHYRLAYCGYGEVNWCEALGTVLANDEVINGVSERGGYPVVKKKLRQWYLRITEYADRLLDGLERVEFSEAMKEMQTNWIGKSFGAEIDFAIRAGSDRGLENLSLRVYTTRPDTIFGVDFMVVAPEHELIVRITSPEQQGAVDEYITYVQRRSERERMAEKKITGCFTGAYALNPFNGREIPIWISEYVLAGYGTGAIMAVPCGDERDHKFAQHFGIPVTNIIGAHYQGVEANPTKEATLSNSEFLDGVVMRDAIPIVNKKLEEMGIGTPKVNYRMRDAAFSRQRYWGEPFPILWRDGIAYPLDEAALPLKLPHVEQYGPGPEGEGPLANVATWTGRHLETNTMPGYAGSSWYFLRYMDPHNDQTFCSREASDYWGQVDLYIGGAEHAVGHLLYSRMWTKFLFDRGYIGFDEPYKRLVNQGMITGISQIIYRYNPHGNPESKFLGDTIPYTSINISDPSSKNAIDLSSLTKKASKGEIPEFYFSVDAIPIGEEAKFSPVHVPIEYVDDSILNIEALVKNEKRYETVVFRCEGGYYKRGEWYNDNKDITSPFKFKTTSVVEKMSKSKLNVVNPNDIIARYGADTYRMYEMFLGPVEQSKPWDTKGIEGVHRFLRKLWRLFYDENKGKVWSTAQANEAEWKSLYKTIKKVAEDTERFSFNTGVSALMIGVNELTDLKCHKKEVLEKLLIVLTPYAPHICEELWHLTGHEGSILDATYPRVEEKYLVESAKNYPIAIDGKTRTEMQIALDATQQQVEEIVLSDEIVKKWLDGKPPKKIVYVKNRMINVVTGLLILLLAGFGSYAQDIHLSDLRAVYQGDSSFLHQFCQRNGFDQEVVYHLADGYTLSFRKDKKAEISMSYPTDSAVASRTVYMLNYFFGDDRAIYDSFKTEIEEAGYRPINNPPAHVGASAYSIERQEYENGQYQASLEKHFKEGKFFAYDIAFSRILKKS